MDVGTLENGSPYIVMEWLHGTDLSVRLQQQGPLDVPEAVDLVMQACEALADVHALGMVHRDIKPANLFCLQGPDGPFVKLLDFGISTPPAGAGVDAIALPEGALLGSPLYMSPEQLRTPAQVDPRADIWSLGVVLHELLAGRTPFEAQSLATLVRAFETGPRSLREVRRDVSPALDHVIATCLQTDRNRRFASVRDLAVALADFASEQGRASVERLLVRQEQPSLTGFELGPVAPLAPEVPASLGLAFRGRTRRQPAVLAAMCMVAAASLCVLAGVLALFARPAGTATPQASGARATASSGGPTVPAVPEVAESVAIPTVSVTDLPVASSRRVLAPRTATSQARAPVAASASASADGGTAE
jgi:serine/threonine-protein kinase